jgi:hypothetical protein
MGKNILFFKSLLKLVNIFQPFLGYFSNRQSGVAPAAGREL